MSIVTGIVSSQSGSSSTITLRYDGEALFNAFPTATGSGLIYRHSVSKRLFEDVTIGSDHWWWPVDFSPVAYTEDGSNNECRIVYSEALPAYMSVTGSSKSANAPLIVDAGSGTTFCALALATANNIYRMFMVWPHTLQASTSYTAYVSGHNNALPRVLVTQTGAVLSALTTPIVNGVNSPATTEPIFMLVDTRNADANVSIFTPSTLIGQEATAPRWMIGMHGSSFFGVTNFDATTQLEIKHMISVEL